MEKDLKKYIAKRNFKVTQEPKAIKKKSNKKLRFVVQYHLASKEHYDFRLEWNGVMKSWAVPKGPSYQYSDKRLAVLVEDHPLEYRNFEGVIPHGEYGGGIVMIWDEGYYEPKNNFEKSFEAGMVKFELNGDRLKGKWALIKFKEDNWLLIKEKDNIEGFKDIKTFKKSIRSNRTIKEISKEYVLHDIKISSPDKVIFEKLNISKMDIVKYYEKVSKRMLPYLDKRIISTIRCPSGINASCFFKKHFETKNKGIKKVFIKNDTGKKEDYYYIKNLNGLISEVQMNGFEFHVWGSKVGKLNKPDVMVFDLDPDDGVDLNQVRQGVKDLKCVLDEFSLVSFLKTSGGKGYHVVVPIVSLKNWNEFKKTAHNIAKLMVERWPDKYVSNMRKDKRKNKIYIDWVRNTKGATSVAPYSLRVREGASISMPIKYSELDKITPNEITLLNVKGRLKRKDPWEGFFNIIQ